MPRPIAAGMFGMARTKALALFSVRDRNCSVRPAMIEITIVDAAIIGASAGITCSAICGFTAMTMAAAPVSASARGLSRTPRSASVLICGDGEGSMTATFVGFRPNRSQPSSSPLPILPAPTSTSRPEKSRKSGAPAVAGSEALIGVFLRLAGCLEHGGVHGFARGFARPNHELERRIIAFAGVERGPEHRLALPA